MRVLCVALEAEATLELDFRIPKTATSMHCDPIQHNKQAWPGLAGRFPVAKYAACHYRLDSTREVADI
jgi:hypothetical protein